MSGCVLSFESVPDLPAEHLERRGRAEMFSAGPSIGGHTGPGTAALFFWGSPP